MFLLRNEENYLKIISVIPPYLGLNFMFQKYVKLLNNGVANSVDPKSGYTPLMLRHLCH